jgi:hypothetical protein
MPLSEAVHLPSPRTSRDLPPAIEQRIGSATTMFAAMLAMGLGEQEKTGKISRETASRAGEFMAELIPHKLRWPEFDHIAREYGRQILWEYLASPPSPVTPNEALVNGMIEYALLVLTNFMKAKTN